jgi:hypothetical protein
MYDLLVIAIVLFCATLGSQRGLRSSSIAFFELLLCLVPAVLLHEWLADWLIYGITAAFEPFMPQGYDLQPLVVPTTFAALLWGSLAVIRGTLHKDGDGEAAMVTINPLIDGVGGIVVGGCGGAVLAGAALVTISMLPVAGWMKPAGERMFFDVGTLALRAGAGFAPDAHEGRSQVLYGEPVKKKGSLSAAVSSEPWFDSDGDGKPTESDRYSDVDGGGTFTKELYFGDLDNDGMRRIGLVDKYVTGRWDGTLRSEGPASPAPEPVRPVRAPAVADAPKPTPDTPPETADGPKPPRLAEWTRGGRLLPKKAGQRPPTRRTPVEMQDDF